MAHPSRCASGHGDCNKAVTMEAWRYKGYHMNADAADSNGHHGSVTCMFAVG